jgi:tricorn protease
MGWGEVERFEQNLFAAADGKEALIIDVRNNGGGWTTDLLLTILTQPVHAYTIPRDGDIGYPQTERQPFYRWSKPIAVICNEGSYSNAEIFSHAIKTIGRGPVVGWETGGNVISTSGFGNRYEGYIRLPFRGWYVWGDKKNPQRNHKNQEGVHELTGFIPDYPVKLTPADRLNGRDPQLQKAIDLMVEAADAEKAKPQREDRP